MHRIILAAALGLASGSALAFQITCDKPEYLQLKTADKAELTDEYCRADQKFYANLKKQSELKTIISERIARGIDVSEDLARRDEELKAGMSCSNAAVAYLGALERRFKLKTRPKCE